MRGKKILGEWKTFKIFIAFDASAFFYFFLFNKMTINHG